MKGTSDFTTPFLAIPRAIFNHSQVVVGITRNSTIRTFYNLPSFIYLFNFSPTIVSNGYACSFSSARSVLATQSSSSPEESTSAASELCLIWKTQLWLTSDTGTNSNSSYTLSLALLAKGLKCLLPNAIIGKSSFSYSSSVSFLHPDSESPRDIFHSPHWKEVSTVHAHLGIGYWQVEELLSHLFQM